MKIVTPKVLVRCMTYNHEPYIEEALNGFVMQKTNFPFIVAVIDDASTDNNMTVIKEFISKNCNRTKNYIEEDKEYGKVIQSQSTNNPNCHFYVVLLNKNHYSDPNKRALRHFYYRFIEDQAKYIAMCEGDDYWTDPNKLQKQVDFLESHPDYIMCCHDVEWHGDQEFQKLSVSSESDIDLKVEDIISRGGYYINICSVVYRKELELTKTNYQKIAQVGDHPLCIKAALSGKVRFMHDTMGVYRCFVKNGWTDRNYHNHQKMAVHLINTIEWMQALNKETKRKYNSSIVQLIGSAYSYSYRYGGFPNRWAYLKASYEAGGKVTIRACKDILIEFFPYLWSCYHAIQIKGKKRMRE